MTPPQDSVSDVERLRAVVRNVLYRSRLNGSSADVYDTADEIVAALAVPINKIGEDATPAYQGCNRPPDGWWCCKKPGHNGPCPTRQIGAPLWGE